MRGYRTVWFVAAALLAAVLFSGIGCGGNGGAGGRPYAKFATDGVSFGVPAGWQATDPFTSATRYWSHLWYHDSPSYQTQVALLKSSQSKGHQFMLLRGKASELEPKVIKHMRKYDQHPLVEQVLRDQVTTADGVAVDVLIARMEPGLLAGKDVTYVLGFAPAGSRYFVLNGGGLTTGFDVEDYRAVIRSLKVKGG